MNQRLLVVLISYLAHLGKYHLEPCITRVFSVVLHFLLKFLVFDSLVCIITNIDMSLQLIKALLVHNLLECFQLIKLRLRYHLVWYDHKLEFLDHLFSIRAAKLTDCNRFPQPVQEHSVKFLEVLVDLEASVCKAGQLALNVEDQVVDVHEHVH